MPDDDTVRDVIDETLAVAQKDSLNPGEYRDIKRAVFGDEFSNLVFSDRAYFVLGNYDGADREDRLELACAILRDRDGAYPFLMSHIPEAWEYWPTKFEILASRTDWFVPVLEDSWGSHSWELGRIASPEYRDLIYALVREYGADRIERAAFDALPAQFLEILDRSDQVSAWETVDDLADAVDEDVPM